MNNRRVKFGEDNRKECGFGKYRTSVLCELKAWTNGIARCLFVALYSYAVFYRLLAVGSICFMEACCAAIMGVSAFQCQMLGSSVQGLHAGAALVTRC